MRESYLPAPFAWIEIPAGKVTLVSEKGRAANYIPRGQTQTFDVPAFAIAKYPITNAQFARFMGVGGYNNRQWWTDAGWDAHEKGCDWDAETSSWESTDKVWKEPRYWQDSKWIGKGKDKPVVGISWYEAIAFCKWLSEANSEKILLPTEEQWQRAAQGDDGRTYPWGNEWNCKRCNNSVRPCESDQTTSVVAYEGKGDSPYGVVDMIGNVWEWCVTSYASGNQDINETDVRVMRGGSWYHFYRDMFRVVDRAGSDPGVREQFYGFRIARSL